MFTIARATENDVDAIKKVLSTTWVDTYASYLSPSTIEQVTTEWHAPNLLRSQIERDTNYFAVAWLDGEIVGLVTVVERNPLDLQLLRLYVLPQHQEKGIGTALLDSALSRYPAARTVRLEVQQQNEKGVSYWRRQHFVAVGSSTQQVGADFLSIVTMERQLESQP
jgi:ribosomal protein S18 acetylase RimI-like enzyme